MRDLYNTVMNWLGYGPAQEPEDEENIGMDSAPPPSIADKLRERDTPKNWVPPGVDENLYK